MEFSRRELLSFATPLGVLGLCFGGRYAHQVYARSGLQHEMLKSTNVLLNEKANDELTTIPSQGREEIREYFHGICLNVRSFIDEIISESFAAKLNACRNEEERHIVLNISFSRKVVPAVEVMNRVETIARDMGKKIDQNWNNCCRKVSTDWQQSLKRPNAVDALDVMNIVTPIIRNDLENARKAAYPIGQRPAITTTVQDVGKTAILLLPVMAAQPEIGFPVFVVAAMRPIWNWVQGKLNHKAEGYQISITEILADMGNRIGAEFQKEARIRIANLHQWQENAMKEAAAIKSTEEFPALI